MSVKIVNVKISMPSSGGGGGNVIVPPVIPPEPPEPEPEKLYALKHTAYNYAQVTTEVVIPEDGLLSFHMVPQESSVTEYAIRSSTGGACVNYRQSDGRFRVCTDDGRLFTFSLTNLTIGTPTYIVIRLIPNGCQLYVDNSLHQEVTGVHTTMTIDQIGEGLDVYGVTLGNIASYPMVVDVVGTVNDTDTIGVNNITYTGLDTTLTIDKYNEVTLEY